MTIDKCAADSAHCTSHCIPQCNALLISLIQFGKITACNASCNLLEENALTGISGIQYSVCGIKVIITKKKNVLKKTQIQVTVKVKTVNTQCFNSLAKRHKPYVLLDNKNVITLLPSCHGKVMQGVTGTVFFQNELKCIISEIIFTLQVLICIFKVLKCELQG